MSRIPVHTLEDAPEDTRQTLAKLGRRTGKLLNVHAEMAHSPVVLAAYAGMGQAIATHASFVTRIALAVGNVDGCDYCQAAHTLSAIKAGLEQDQTIAIRAGEIDFDDKLAALLAVVRERGRRRVRCDLEGRARGGLDRTRARRGVRALAANLFTNYFNHYARTELDVPAALPLTR